MKKLSSMNMLSKKIIYSILLIVVGLYAMKALFHPGFFTSLDGWHNIARLYHFDQAIGDQQIPPRWISQLAGGFGYPLFIFSYPMPWIIAEVFVLSGVSIIVAVKIVLGVTFIGSGLVMYYWMSEMFDNEAGFVSAFVYMWTPYRFAKIFVGASVGEATVFLFIPLFFWGIYKITKNETKVGILLGSLGLAGIVLSHFMILPIISIMVIVLSLLFYKYAKNRMIFTKNYFFLILLGILLCAFYLFPLLIYSADIKAKTMQGGFASMYENHFVTLKQLFYSKWGYGPVINSAKDGEISFQVGISQWLAVFFTLLALFINRAHLFSKNKPLIIASLFAFGVSIFLMTDISKTLWNQFHPYIFIDYPWRFLAITTFSGAILSAVAVSFFSRIKYVFVVGIIFVAIFTNRNHLGVNLYTDIPLQLYVDSETTTNTFAEYLPRWSQVDIGKKPVQFLDPSDDVLQKNIVQNTNTIEVISEAQKKTEVTFNQLYFPGMNIFLDGQKQEIQYRSDGRIILETPVGLHTFLLRFVPTTVMKLADISTVIGIFVWVILFASLMRTNAHVIFKKRTGKSIR